MESGRPVYRLWRTAHTGTLDYPQLYPHANGHAHALSDANLYTHASNNFDAIGDKMPQIPFQDYYPDHMAHCYGCGRLNQYGYQIKSLWDENNPDESVAYFTPKPQHIAIPGYVYGGLLASLIDCHGTGTAAAAAYREAGRLMDTEPALRFLTGSLHVDYLKPTPLGPTLEVRGRVKEVKGRKVVIEEWIVADDVITVRGEVVAVQVPEHLIEELLQG